MEKYSGEYLQINLNNLIEQLGENRVKSILSNFECKKIQMFKILSGIKL